MFGIHTWQYRWMKRFLGSWWAIRQWTNVMVIWSRTHGQRRAASLVVLDALAGKQRKYLDLQMGFIGNWLVIHWLAFDVAHSPFVLYVLDIWHHGSSSWPPPMNGWRREQNPTKHVVISVVIWRRRPSVHCTSLELYICRGHGWLSHEDTHHHV